jgi:hypothetical protein
VNAVGDTVEKALRDLSLYGPEDVKRLRREKFLAIGRLEGAA